MDAETRLQQFIAEHDPRHRLYYQALLKLGRELRGRLDWFRLEHLSLLADELAFEFEGAEILPHDLNPTSEAIGLVAAGTWGGTIEDRFLWTQRILGLVGEPSARERDLLLQEVRRCNLAQNARWSS